MYQQARLENEHSKVKRKIKCKTYTYLVNNVGLNRINNAHFSKQMISKN